MDRIYRYDIEFKKPGRYRYGGWPLKYDSNLVCILPRALQVPSIAFDLSVRFKGRGIVHGLEDTPNLFEVDFSEDFE